jgi:RNA 2',3'-cyclic 3'-phosphodiesterase
VTIAFLGSVDPGSVEDVWRAARGAAPAGPVRLEPAAIEGVPRRRPRLLALALGDPDGEAAALAGGVGEALAREDLYEPEERPFWPHVTVARVRRGAREEVPAGPGPAVAPFAAPALTLYRSKTSPKGARYTALERLELPA